MPANVQEKLTYLQPFFLGLSGASGGNLDNFSEGGRWWYSVQKEPTTLVIFLRVQISNGAYFIGTLNLID